MSENDIRDMVLKIMDNERFIKCFYDSKGERIIPQIIIKPKTSKTVKINAFAKEEIINGKQVLIIKVTEDLLTHYTKRQINFALAHELAHLKYGDYRERFNGISNSIIFVALLAIGLSLFTHPVFPIILVIWYAYYSSKMIYDRIQFQEYRADREGASLDAQAAISALDLLSRYYEKPNPNFIDNFLGAFSTHPFLTLRKKRIIETKKCNTEEISSLEKKWFVIFSYSSLILSSGFLLRMLLK